jgi:hypothetical protein
LGKNSLLGKWSYVKTKQRKANKQTNNNEGIGKWDREWRKPINVYPVGWGVAHFLCKALGSNPEPHFFFKANQGLWGNSGSGSSER